MAVLDEAELAELSAGLLEGLEASEYPCSSLTLLTGGSTNLVYRGILKTPNSARDTVIIKCTASFLAINPAFEIDASRCVRRCILDHCSFAPGTDTTRASSRLCWLLSNP
jgi:hypothetical protein